MRIVIIGGSGHIGSYLVPRLSRAGHYVIVVSRRKSIPYNLDPAWDKVEHAEMDREMLEQKGMFGETILALNPDIVIDLICFKLDSAKQIVKALDKKIKQYIFCGTIWVYGYSVEVPTDENQTRHPLTQYAIDKAEIENYLLTAATRSHFPATILHPGHIVGPGWRPVNPAGNLNIDIFGKLSRGEEVLVPNLGMETLHHVHADDVAQAFELSINKPKMAIGHSFNIISPKALSFRGYAESMANWFGVSANLKFLPFEEWRKQATDIDATITWDHLIHSPNCSIEKAMQLLGYKPQYSSLQAVQESITWQKLHSKHRF